MNKLRSFALAALALAALTPPLFAQTPTPTPDASPNTSTASPTPTATPVPTYLSGTAPAAARIADAKNVMATTTDPDTLALATLIFDKISLDTAKGSTWPAIAPIAQNIIAKQGNVTPATTPDQASTLMNGAVSCTASYGYTDNWDRVTFLKPLVTALSPTDTSVYAGNLIDTYAMYCVRAAGDCLNVRDFTDATTLLAEPAILDSPTRALDGIFMMSRLQTAERLPTAIGMAKVAYIVSRFKNESNSGNEDTQGGINAVSAAFRALEGSTADSNPFIAAQTDGTAPDLLANVAIPAPFNTGPLPNPQFAALNLALEGDTVGSINTALSNFGSADTNKEFQAGVAGVAQALRNYYHKIVEPNIYVDDMNKGLPYTFKIPGVVQMTATSTPTPTPTPAH